MIFSSLTFLIFFVVVLGIMLLFNISIVKNRFNENLIRNIRHYILLVSSYVFYGWWDWRFCFLMLFMTFISYICARQIEKKRTVRFFKILGVAIPLLTLGFFKYFNFFVDSFCKVFAIDGFNALNIILPVGISFYTFQSMSYTIDVMRGKIRSYGFLEVALYVAFFPQLVAGPIVKASEFIPQLSENRILTKNNFLTGIQIFVFGLFKKIVIADHLSVFVDDVFSKPLAFASVSVILAVVAYSIQIYFDFSGYSDMAVGVAKCLGYDFNRNFNIPYISKNVSEFWKRWHISLSTWLQEYLYIPLGGNRKGKTRTYINLMITMLLGGLWHGASFNFIIWGALHGLALCIHKIYSKRIGKKMNFGVIGNLVSILLTYSFVCICWVFFRAENLKVAFNVLYRMFVWKDGILQIFSWAVVAIILLLIGELAAYCKAKKNNESITSGYYFVVDLSKFWSQVLFFVALGLILATAYTGANPFVYFQF